MERYAMNPNPNRLIIIGTDDAPAAPQALAFTCAADVATYFGSDSHEAKLATEYFGANGQCDGDTLYFTRWGLNQRPHLEQKHGLNMTNVKGSLSITFNGDTYATNVNLTGATILTNQAGMIEKRLNASRKSSMITGTITPELVTFNATISREIVTVTSSDGPLVTGGEMMGDGFATQQIVFYDTSKQEATLFKTSIGDRLSGTFEEAYGLLTTSAHVTLGEEVSSGSYNGYVDKKLSASDTYVLSQAPTSEISGGITTRPTPLTINTGRGYLDIAPDGYAGFNNNPSELSYASGTAADALGLSQTSGAMLSPLGGQHQSAETQLDGLLANNVNFGSYQSMVPNRENIFEPWGLATGHDFITTSYVTTLAGH